jgi:hypothetical protein
MHKKIIKRKIHYSSMGNEHANNKSEKVSNSALMEYSNGEKYIGETSNGLRDGYGTYYYHNGEKYEGHWLKNTKNGNYKIDNLFLKLLLRNIL